VSEQNLDHANIDLSLRFVRCLPANTGMRGRDDATRAGVGQASKEETAACPDAVRGS
jgi:hypothetical protein